MSSLLPPNATELEHALDDSTARLSDIPVPNRTLWGIDTCPAAVLPWLAWAVSVDEWDDAWPEATQRAVIAASVAVHRHKGTRHAVQLALSALADRIDLVEWWQESPAGEPHTFRLDVEISQRAIDIATLDQVERQVVSVKPARSHFTTRLLGSSRGALRRALCVLDGGHAVVRPYLIPERSVSGGYGFGAAVHASDLCRLEPGT